MIAFFQFRDTNVVYAENINTAIFDILQPVMAKSPVNGKLVKLYFKKYLKNKKGALFIESTEAGEVLGG